MNPLRFARQFSLIVVVILLGSMVLAACGGDDDDDDASESTATEQVTEDESTEAGTEATEAETEADSTTTESEATEAEAGSTESAGIEVNYESLEGRINVDGSSTVFPITQAMGEEFQFAAPNVQVPVGVSGTGGGFEKFCNGETDISDASRPIKPEEAQLCADNGIEYIEIPVAWDGISVVVNPANDWVECLTTEELQKMWSPDAEGEVTSWSDIRPEFPDEPLELYGPGTDSGTYDYFTDAIVGEEGASRGDYTASEKDNILVQGVAGNQSAIGFFGYAYYEENQDNLKLLGIDSGEGCVQPSPETINDGSYQPLSRPIFIYVSTAAAERPEVAAFIEFYLTSAPSIVPQVGYVPFDEALYSTLLERFAAGTTGSVFEQGGSTEGVTVDDLLFEDEQVS